MGSDSLVAPQFSIQIAVIGPQFLMRWTRPIRLRLPPIVGCFERSIGSLSALRRSGRTWSRVRSPPPSGARAPVSAAAAGGSGWRAGAAGGARVGATAIIGGGGCGSAAAGGAGRASAGASTPGAAIAAGAAPLPGLAR
jgi:hypothetical protein